MNLVFFGASELGYQCCRLIFEKQLANIVGIFTIPREFNISYSDKPVRNVLFKDFHALGEKYKTPVIEITGKMRTYQKQLETLKPDFMLAIGWYYMIPKTLREIAPLGCAGIHASLLPKYRGGAPLVWAIINGETESGVSFFYFESGVDTGDIIAQKKFPIAPEETIKEILGKATEASLNVIEEYIPKIARGAAPRIPQNHEEATSFPQRSPEDGEIDWSWEPQKIRNFIRAQTKPYPGAFTIIKGKKVTIWNADIIEV